MYGFGGVPLAATQQIHTAADPRTGNSCRRRCTRATKHTMPTKQLETLGVAACRSSCKQCACACACCSAEHVVEGHPARLCVVAEGAQLAERLERHARIVEGAAAAQPLAQHVLHTCFLVVRRGQEWWEGVKTERTTTTAVRKKSAHLLSHATATARSRVARCAPLLYCSRFQVPATIKQTTNQDNNATTSASHLPTPARRARHLLQ